MTPITRTLPPVDVIFEGDAESAESAPERKSLSVSASDLAVLRRIVLDAAPAETDSKPPESRSLRAAKKTLGAGRYVAVITGTFALATEVLRLWHPEYVSVLGAAARFVQQLVNAQ